MKRFLALFLLLTLFSTFAVAENIRTADHEVIILGPSTELNPPQLVGIASLKPGDSYEILAVIDQSNAAEQEPLVQEWLDTYILHQIRSTNPRTNMLVEGYILGGNVPQDINAIPEIKREYGRLVSVEGRDTDWITFEAVNKQDEGYLLDDPPLDVLPLETALRIALDTLMKQYGESEATLKRFYIRYGHHPAEYIYPARWQFDFYSYLHPLDGYFITIDSHTGETLTIAGPGDGVG